MGDLNTRLRQAFSAIPLKTTLAVVAICFIVRENFPFSHFPMYSSFDKYSYYIHIADKDGKPLPIFTLSGHRTSSLKKIYNSELKRTRERLEADGVEIKGLQFMTPDQRQPAGQHVLDWILNNTKEHLRPGLEEHRPLQVFHTHLRAKDGETVPETQFITHEG